MPNGTIRDPIHNKFQGKFGVVWIHDEKDPNKGELAVYDKKEDDQLRNLPSGWQISSNSDLETMETPFMWCGVLIEKKIVKVNIGGSTGAASQLIGSTLRNNPILMIQDLKNPELDSKDERSVQRIYPLTLE
jgi:hypothetical protein